MAESVASLVERLNATAEKAEGVVVSMNNGGKWRMRVPANPDDPDLILSELVNVAREAASRLSSPEGTRDDLNQLVRQFIDYYTSAGGCANCGGLPHSSSCFVWRFEQALSSPSSAPAATPAKEPQCTGPFSDAYDCPVHDPRKRQASPRVSAATPVTYHHEPTCKTFQQSGDCTCDPLRLGWTHGPLDSDFKPASAPAATPASQPLVDHAPPFTIDEVQRELESLPQNDAKRLMLNHLLFLLERFDHPASPVEPVPDEWCRKFGCARAYPLASPVGKPLSELTGEIRGDDPVSAAERPAPTWQPIESAPKDGATILGWFPYYATVAEGGDVFVMRWNDDHYHKKPRPYWDASGWVWGVRDNRAKQPTHWMPLPAPPGPVAQEKDK